MTNAELKAYTIEFLSSVKGDYVKDLEAMTHEQLAASPGGKARSAYDFTYEVAMVNRRIAKRMGGSDPGPWDHDGWVTSPDEYKDKAKAIDNLSSSIDALISALEAVPEADIGREIATPNGATNAFKLAHFAAYHSGYHDAQLNLIQSLAGDDQVHWT